MLEYRTHRLADRVPHYNDEVDWIVAECAKHLNVQMRSEMFDSLDHISILINNAAFKLREALMGYKREPFFVCHISL